jgi:hypothetical protein
MPALLTCWECGNVFLLLFYGVNSMLWGGDKRGVVGGREFCVVGGRGLS